MKTVKCKYQRPVQRLQSVANKQNSTILGSAKNCRSSREDIFLGLFLYVVSAGVCGRMKRNTLTTENRPSWDLMKLNYIVPLPEFLDEIPWCYHFKKSLSLVVVLRCNVFF